MMEDYASRLVRGMTAYAAAHPFKRMLQGFNHTIIRRIATLSRITPRRALLLFGYGTALGIGITAVLGGWPPGALAADSSADRQIAADTDVIWIVLESTRADHIGPCYGYHRPTAPNICKLADDGVLFEQAYAQGTWTAIATPTMMTGLSPSAAAPHGFRSGVPAPLPFIQKVLGGHGMTTINTDVKQPQWGIHRGFNHSVPFSDIDFGRGRVFAWHFFNEAHFEYIVPPQHRIWDNVSLSNRELWQIADRTDAEGTEPAVAAWLEHISLSDLITLYDQRIRVGDMKAGQMIQQLKEQGVYNDSMIIITADHGEYFGEYCANPRETPKKDGCLMHNGIPYAEVIHVPLIIKFPDNRFAGQRVQQPVRHIDIVPTILDVLRLPSSHLPGRSLITALHNPNQQLPVYAADRPLSKWLYRNDTFKYFLYNVNETCTGNAAPLDELYRTDTDPALGDTLVQKLPEPRTALKTNLCRTYRRGVNRRPGPSSGNLSESMLEQLEELGYIN